MSKADKKQRQRKRKAQAKKLILETIDRTGWKINTEWHWQRPLCGLKLDYWPTTKKAMFNGNVYKNVENINDLAEALAKNFGNN